MIEDQGVTVGGGGSWLTVKYVDYISVVLRLLYSCKFKVR